MQLLADCCVGADFLGFLLISSPRKARISWVRLPQNPAESVQQMSPQTLVEGGHLLHPQGIAVDQKHRRLLVADPDNRTIWGYHLVMDGGMLSAPYPPEAVASGLESRWVASDANGNVVFSVEPNNTIWKMAGTVGDDSEPNLSVLYYGSSVPQVNTPGGVAVDNLHVYWTNKHYGLQTGVVVKASEDPVPDQEADSISVLAQNTQKSYGVCLALGNVFYTDSKQNLYGVKSTGGESVVINSRFKKPRGCVWDGDGTVYVADRGAGAVYFFFGNMVELIHTDAVSKAFSLEDAFGLAFLAAPPEETARSFLRRLW